MKLIKAEEMRIAFRNAELDYSHNGLPLENVKGWMLEYLDNAPEIQVVPVIHAQWYKNDDDQNVYQCSNCFEEQVFEEGTPEENDVRYCPYCGARMDEEAER